MKGFTFSDLLVAALVIAVFALVIWSISSPMGCVYARNRVEFYEACERNASCRLEAYQAHSLAGARKRAAECSRGDSGQ